MTRDLEAAARVQRALLPAESMTLQCWGTQIRKDASDRERYGRDTMSYAEL